MLIKRTIPYYAFLNHVIVLKCSMHVLILKNTYGSERETNDAKMVFVITNQEILPHRVSDILFATKRCSTLISSKTVQVFYRTTFFKFPVSMEKRNFHFWLIWWTIYKIVFELALDGKNLFKSIKSWCFKAHEKK